jgi:hypothetical protein
MAQSGAVKHARRNRSLNLEVEGKIRQATTIGRVSIAQDASKKRM